MCGVDVEQRYAKSSMLNVIWSRIAIKAYGPIIERERHQRGVTIYN